MFSDSLERADGGLNPFIDPHPLDFSENTRRPQAEQYQSHEESKENNNILTFGQSGRPPMHAKSTQAAGHNQEYYSELREKYMRDLELKRQRDQGPNVSRDQKSPSILNRSLERIGATQPAIPTQTTLSSGQELRYFPENLGARPYASNENPPMQFGSSDQFDMTGAESSLQGGRPKKAVRFQVYNAKDMETLKSMRHSMEEKFARIVDRSRSPAQSRSELLSQMRQQSQSNSQLSGLGFKPGEIAAAQSFKQLANQKKTPRPGGLLGQSIPDSSDRGSGREKELRTTSDVSPRGHLTSSLTNSKSSPGPHTSLHSRSIARDRCLRIEQGLLRLASSLDDVFLVRKSRTLIDSFDLVKCFADERAVLYERVEKARGRHCRKTAFKAFKKWVAMQRRKRLCEQIVEYANQRRESRLKKKILGKVKRVLILEAIWLKEVRYQFAFGIREQALNAFKTYVKYRRAKNACKMNRYRALMHRLALMVEDSRIRQAQATAYHLRRQTEQVQSAMRQYTRMSILKKVKLGKARRFARNKLQERALAEWKHQVATMNRIRGDQLLWQAHSTNSEFFSVSVKVGATLDYKSVNPVLQQRHFLLADASELSKGVGRQQDGHDGQQEELVYRERVKMGLGNMVSIKLD